MMTDDEIGEKIRGRGLEEEYIRELMASLGFDPAEGFTNAGHSRRWTPRPWSSAAAPPCARSSWRTRTRR